MRGTTIVGLGMATSGGCGWKTRDAGFGSALALTVGIFCDDLRHHIIKHFARFLRSNIFVNRTFIVHCSRGWDGDGRKRVNIGRIDLLDRRQRGDGLHGDGRESGMSEHAISPRAPPPADAKSEYGTRQPKLTECVALDAIGARGFGSPAYRGLSCVYGRAPTPGKEAARAKPPASTFLNFS